MATYFSNALGADGSGDTTLEQGKRHLPGQGSAIKRIGAFVTQDTANGDVLRFFSLPSSARIMAVRFSSTAGGAGTADVGLYLKGTAHDGAVVDDDLFASAIAFTTAVALGDVFTEATTLGDQDRGKTLWQLADLGAATLTADPLVEYDFCVVHDTGAGAGTTQYLEVDYF